jgi:acetyl esterase/lipase
MAEGQTDRSVTIPDVSYGSDALQKMDIYLPADRSSATTKVLIFIHGGWWFGGDKRDLTYAGYIDNLKRREPSYAIFNINYRLAIIPNLFPTQELDVKAAVEFIYNKRFQYGVSDKFVLFGVSAGAHLALLQGYKYSTPVKPKAIIDFSGPTDLFDMYNNPANSYTRQYLLRVTGSTPTSNNAIYTQSSPINFVSSENPPTIIFHGGTDNVISPSQSDALNTKLQIASANHQYYFYPTNGHPWGGANLYDSFDKIQAFLAAYVN